MESFALRRCELGVATSATQIEGGHADTNWHRWAARGRARDGSGPTVAADHWNRVADDLDLLRELGVRHYRMGLEWARIEPEPGEFDTAAIAHYRDELAGLRAAGIAPLVTLHHFSEPGWLSERGGFGTDAALAAFARYVERVVLDLGDLADEWITINEPNVYAYQGYYQGSWPPGERTLRGYLGVAARLARAHLDAYRAIHRLRPSARVSFAQHLRVFDPLHAANPFDRASASGTAWVFQGALTQAMARGRFVAPLVQPRGVRPGRYYDFLGVNYYSRTLISGPQNLTARGAPVSDLGWEIYPDGLVRVLEWLHRRFPGPIYVTENGVADAADSFRARFLYDHLARIAASERLPVQRYYHWTLTDNWEWAEGQTARFGLVELDPATQQRRMRASGRFFASIAANCGVTQDAYDEFVAPQRYPQGSR